MTDIRQRHIAVMQHELEYLYEILDGSESKAEKLTIQTQAMKLYQHILKEQSILDKLLSI